jgi:hypothetical protein
MARMRRVEVKPLRLDWMEYRGQQGAEALVREGQGYVSQGASFRTQAAAMSKERLVRSLYALQVARFHNSKARDLQDPLAVGVLSYERAVSARIRVVRAELVSRGLERHEVARIEREQVQVARRAGYEQARREYESKRYQA